MRGRVGVFLAAFLYYSFPGLPAPALPPRLVSCGGEVEMRSVSEPSLCR